MQLSVSRKSYSRISAPALQWVESRVLEAEAEGCVSLFQFRGGTPVSQLLEFMVYVVQGSALLAAIVRLIAFITFCMFLKTYLMNICIGFLTRTAVAMMVIQMLVVEYGAICSSVRSHRYLICLFRTARALRYTHSPACSLTYSLKGKRFLSMNLTRFFSPHCALAVWNIVLITTPSVH